MTEVVLRKTWAADAKVRVPGLTSEEARAAFDSARWWLQHYGIDVEFTYPEELVPTEDDEEAVMKKKS